MNDARSSVWPWFASKLRGREKFWSDGRAPGTDVLLVWPSVCVRSSAHTARRMSAGAGSRLIDKGILEPPERVAGLFGWSVSYEAPAALSKREVLFDPQLGASVSSV
jgi:hypothetical protein